MALKGVCSVEVRNADGSLAQRTTDENMVTNYLSNLINPDCDFFKGFFDIDVTCFDYAFYPLIDKVIGGVLLFGETLPEDPDYKIPKVPLVGHASTDYQIDVPTYGLLNRNESNFLTNENGKVRGFKYVWDFATDRANGTIKCISLTTGRAGTKGNVIQSDSKLSSAANVNLTFPRLFSGLSNKDSDYYALNISEMSTGKYLLSSDTNSKPSDIINYGSNSYRKIVYNYIDFQNGIFKTPIIIANIKKDVVVCITGITENSITLAKYKIKRNIGLYQERYTFKDRTELIEEKKVNFDKLVFKRFGANNCYYLPVIIFSKIYTDENYLYVSYLDNGEFGIYKIDPNTFDIAESSHFVTEIEGVGKNTGTYYPVFNGCVLYEGCYYMGRYWNSNDGSEKKYRLDLIKVNPDDINAFETMVTIDTHNNSEYNGYYCMFSVYDGVLFVIAPGNSCYSIYKGKIISKFYGVIPIASANIQFPYMIGKRYESYNTSIGFGAYNEGLITIDNLSTPIVKNNTQTMKITYEITETE